MTVIEIVKEYLKSNGFDGLCGDECGCGLDDLVACDGDFSQCSPAYKHKCLGEQCTCQCDAYDGDDSVKCFSETKPVVLDTSEKLQ